MQLAVIIGSGNKVLMSVGGRYFRGEKGDARIYWIFTLSDLDEVKKMRKRSGKIRRERQQEGG